MTRTHRPLATDRAGRWHRFGALPRRRVEEGVAFGSGLLAVYGLPGDLLFPAALVGFALFFRLVVAVPPRRGLFLGWIFGLGHFSLGLTWLYRTLHDLGGLPLPVALAMLFLLASVLALYPAIFGGLLPSLAPRPWLLPLVAPALWVVTEWLRGSLFTGFPWNLAGYMLTRWESMLQVADLGGVLLLSFVALLPSAVLAWLFTPGVGRTARMAAPLLPVLLWGVVFLYGEWRLVEVAEEGAGLGPPVRVGLVQGNIPQHLKWEVSQQEETLERYLSLSASLTPPVDLVVWPETAIPFFVQASPESVERLTALSRQLRAPVLSGVPTADRREGGGWRFYNSVLMFTDEGGIRYRYDKRHLVPFGEFIPLRRWVPGTFHKFTEGTEDFTPGSGSPLLPWSLGGIGPLICFEAIFSEEVARVAASGARWLVNVTNDAWFGEKAKPQHLAMTRVRAVESRLPLIRVANTGISAAFDATGHLLGAIPSAVAGARVVEVPRGAGGSFFVTSARWWICVWLGLALLPGVVFVLSGGRRN
ncbi:MAG: apolipoprotein N-acyltransferase [Magnetococcales bacterium]|nr:apolipoprotein N-acyltransferase [Magnetococcales bacterium]MBF0157395.1 apolipoprotein N-acyltransferase [Magnetococcales bacterium]